MQRLSARLRRIRTNRPHMARKGPWGIMRWDAVAVGRNHHINQLKGAHQLINRIWSPNACLNVPTGFLLDVIMARAPKQAPA